MYNVVHTGFGLWYQLWAPPFKGDVDNLSDVKVHPDEIGCCGDLPQRPVVRGMA